MEEKIDYTLTDGKYYKVINENQEIITFGSLVAGQLLSTLSEVIFITRYEYTKLLSQQNNQND